MRPKVIMLSEVLVYITLVSLVILLVGFVRGGLTRAIRMLPWLALLWQSTS